MARHLARLAKEAQQSRSADARRRKTHPGNPDVVVCRSQTGAKLRRVDGVMTFIPGKPRTYVELRSDLEHPGGQHGGAMPSALRGTHLQPVPNQHPVVTQRKSVRVKPWLGIAGAEPSGHNDLRSREIHPPVILSHTGKSNGGASDARAESMRKHVSSQYLTLHHK